MMNTNEKHLTEEAFTNLFTSLFSKEWKGKAIWESIGCGNLTAAPCLVGNQFHNQSVKVMVVGRSVNGWEVKFNDCSSLNATTNSVLTQKNRLDDFVRISTTDEHGKEYYYAKSPFLRMMRQLVEAFTGTDENWQQRLVWSNLFKIAPRNGGNPSWLMVRDDIPLYCEIIREEIRRNRPNVVVFATDMNFFDPYGDHPKYASFKVLINETKQIGIQSEYICMSGNFVDDQNIKMIVCKRPEGRPIAEMVKDIVAVYNKLTEK